MLVTVAVPLGTAAPPGSVTVPTMSAVVTCALSFANARRENNTVQKTAKCGLGLRRNWASGNSSECMRVTSFWGISGESEQHRYTSVFIRAGLARRFQRLSNIDSIRAYWQR